MQEITDWSCQLQINISRSSVTALIRECIPKLDITVCSSTGNINVTFMECICQTDGCNSFVREDQNDTTSTTTTTVQTTTATDIDNGNGSVNLRWSSVYIACSFIAYFFTITISFGLIEQ